MLDESVSLMKHSITVTAFLSLLNKRVLLPQVNAWGKNKTVEIGLTNVTLASCIDKDDCSKDLIQSQALNASDLSTYSVTSDHFNAIYLYANTATHN